MKPSASRSTGALEPEEKHSAAIRVALGDQLVGYPPLGRGHGLQLPTIPV